MVSLMYHQHAWILIPEMTRYATKHALIFHDLHISFIKLWKYPYVPLLWVHYTIWNIFHECRNVQYEFVAVNDPPEETDNTYYHSFFWFQILHFVTQLCFFKFPCYILHALQGNKIWKVTKYVFNEMESVLASWKPGMFLFARRL